MNPRRQHIREAMALGGNGGTTAPARGGRRPMRPVRRQRPGVARRRPTDPGFNRGGGVQAPFMPEDGAGGGMSPGPQLPVAAGHGQEAIHGGRREGVAEGFQAGLGKQLSRRVSSGAIDQDQAEQVSGDRELLEQAFGPDWRVKVFGDRGLMQRNRQQIGAGSQDPAVQALNARLMQDRKRALEQARAKLGAE